MRIRWVVAGLLLCGLAFSAEVPAAVRKLAGLAASLPPEFQSDTLLQIVESRGGLDAAAKKDLLEQAFVLARQAKYPYPKTAMTGLNADSRQAFQAQALALKLDRLSLEMRAIRDMLALDPLAAGLLFQQTQKPAPPPGTCADALIPQLDDYYDVGAQIVSRGFTAKEIDREEHLALALRILAGVKAHHEVAPAARMVADARLTALQFSAALTAFTARLDAISGDDRAFVESARATQQEISALARRAPTVARAYRKYLAGSLTTPHCADYGRAQGTNGNPIDWFNQSDLRGDLPVIEWKDSRTKETAESKLQIDAFWSTIQSAKILIAAQGLRTAPTGESYSQQDRSSTEWTRKLQDLLVQLSDWKQSDEESDLDFFHQKATVYESMIDVCPEGDARQRLIHAFVGFLNNSEAASKYPVDWFWHVQNMYRRMRQGGDRDAAKLVAAYRGSGNLMLAVYMELSGH